MTLDEARATYGPRVLLRKDSRDGSYRPVFPQPRHHLPPDAYAQQLRAFAKWKSRAVNTVTTQEKEDRHEAERPEV